MNASSSIVRPRDAAEALAARRALGAGAAYVAGATALQLSWAERRPSGPLVDLSALPREPVAALVRRGAGEWLRLSCLATLEEMRTAPLVRLHCPGLVEAVGAIAALGVRHLATLGGNIAWRSGDLVPFLLACGADTVSLPGGREALADWLKRPRQEDLLLSVELPLPASGAVWFEKIGYRAAFTPSLVSVAALPHFSEGRLAAIQVAVGGGANRPGLVSELAPLLVGTALREIDAVALGKVFLRSGLLAEDAFASSAHRATVAARLLCGRLAAAAP